MSSKLNSYLLTPTRTLRRWEGVLLALLALLVLGCGWLSLEQEALADRMVRLHVVANSDEEEDQQLKLQVRDRVVSLTAGWLSGTESAQQAMDILEDHLDDLTAAAQETVTGAGYDYPVTVCLETAHFPTKTYEGFALPAGDYQALRVILGAGEGHNWWCVIFPSLCVTAASDWEETAVSGGMTEEDVGLMSQDTEGYVLKFKCLEWWDHIRTFFMGSGS